MKKILIITMLVAYTLVGCKKNLELKPISLITKESFLKVEGDVEPAINGMYFRIRPMANLDFFVYGEARSEVMGASITGTLGYEKFYTNTLNKENPHVEWTPFYQTINAANLIIKYTPGITFGNINTKNDALAQAYTMRAYMYFLMAKIWGSVPVRLEPTEGFDPVEIQIVKTPEADVFKQIKDDLNKAIALYSTNTIPTGRFKWSKPSANAIKGDVYLWTAKRLGGGGTDLNVALTALNDVQTSTTALSLVPNFADIFKYANKGNNEIIMAVRFTSSEPANPLQTYAHNMYASNTAFPAYIPQAQKDIVGVPLAGNGNVWQMTKLVRDQFTNDDTRKAATYVDLFGPGPTEYFCNYGLKFNGTVENGARIFASDFILYRYADILLMKAEAKNALLQDPTTEINLVRQRAYGSNYPSHVFVNGSQESNDDTILKERLFELTLESKRWYDLVRFGKAFTLVPSLVGKSAQTYLLYWPIGNTTRTKEPLVTETPGW
ncbi:MAG: RagB/SusD family nutrient uptake outer membrane protein [Opitutaceae bacterium]|nr:RagB/SusD family nutrient uptake outer membrane protein [Cytophagales bacterium]